MTRQSDAEALRLLAQCVDRLRDKYAVGCCVEDKAEELRGINAACNKLIDGLELELELQEGEERKIGLPSA